MKVIKPVVFQAANLISTTATETYAAWSSATTYAIGARVSYLDKGIYESLVASNLNQQPDLQPTKWIRVQATNKLAMFDLQTTIATTATSTLTVVLAPGIINSIGLVNLVGTSISITATDGAGGPVVFTKTASLVDDLITDYYEYFFEPFTQLGELVVTNLPPYSNMRLTITVTGSSTVQIGELVFGTVYDIGLTEYGATVGIIDYGKKEVDQWGNTVFTKGNFSKRTEQNIFMENSKINRVERLLAELRATPTVWIGSEEANYSSLIVFGAFKDFSINVKYPTVSYCSLQIEGLT